MPPDSDISQAHNHSDKRKQYDVDVASDELLDLPPKDYADLQVSIFLPHVSLSLP